MGDAVQCAWWRCSADCTYNPLSCQPQCHPQETSTSLGTGTTSALTWGSWAWTRGSRQKRRCSGARPSACPSASPGGSSEDRQPRVGRVSSSPPSLLFDVGPASRSHRAWWMEQWVPLAFPASMCALSCPLHGPCFTDPLHTCVPTLTSKHVCHLPALCTQACPARLTRNFKSNSSR